jgi:hypothetical protein
MRSLLVEESLLNESGLLRHVRLLFLDDVGVLIIHAYVVMCMEALTQFKPMQYKSYTYRKYKAWATSERFYAIAISHSARSACSLLLYM